MELIPIKLLLTFGFIFAILWFLTGCSTIGTGRSTIVLAPKPENSTYSGDEFSALISNSSSGVDLRATGSGKAFTLTEWNDLVVQRFGGQPNSHPDLGSVSIVVRDRTRTPTFEARNFDFDREDEVVKILLDPNLKDDQRAVLLERARNNYVTLPEAGSRVVFDRRYPADSENAGAPQWRYFVELEVSLTGTLESADPSQTFSYLGAALRIPDTIDARFINFSPKAADLYEIAIGNLSSSAKLTGSLGQGRTGGTEDTIADTTVTGLSDTAKTTSGTNLTASTGFELSESLAREINLGLDTRATGIHDDGKVFMMELRGTDTRRIAGTYSYLVMLEVQSSVEHLEEIENYILAQPVARKIDLETRAVGVVRHVVSRGQTGTLNKVPEPLNDHTFNQVILSEGLIEDAWRFSELPRGDEIAAPTAPQTLIVRTALPKANYFISDMAGNVLRFGSGTQQTFPIPAGTKVTVNFLPVVEANGSVVEFVAAPKVVQIPESGSAIVVGEYALKSVHVAGNGGD